MATFITGDRGSFTFSGASGNTLVVANFDYWSLEDSLQPQLYRPFGWSLPTANGKTPVLRGVLRQAYDGDSATPPIPNMARGTLRLYVKSTTAYYEFKASLFGYRVLSDSTDGGLIMCEYQFIVNASASGDGVTVA